jgi:hypothetical protein
MKTLGVVIAMVYFGMVADATALETGTQGPVAPRLLSETGLYADVARLKVAPRNRNFSPQYPLWSDGATKRRWIQLPAGSQIDTRDLGKWDFPVGTRFWKEFSFQGRKVETRFLWRTSKDNWVFASYAWNEAQTDAVLASERGIANIAEVADGKRHSIPSISECRACHDSKRTEILGFDALQLSNDRDPNALHGEPLTREMLTLSTLVDENLLSPRRVELVTTPPRIAAASPVTRTALGYLSTNCGNCHNRESSIASLGLNLKHTIPGAGSRDPGAGECTAAIATTVGKRGHWVVPEAPGDSRIINPGRPDASSLIRRVKSRRPLSQMPPIGTVVADRQAVDLLTMWIAGNESEWKQLAARCATLKS